MRVTLGWLARTGFLYLSLFAAIAFFVFAWPAITDGFSAETLRQDTLGEEQLRDTLSQDRNDAQARLESRLEEIGTLSSQGLEKRRSQLARQRSAIDDELAEGGGWLDGLRPSRILATKRLELRRTAIDAEIAAIEAAQERNVRRGTLRAAQDRLAKYRRIPTENAVSTASTRCSTAERQLRDFRRLPEIEQGAREIFLGESERFEARRKQACDLARQLEDRRNAGLEARAAYTQARASLEQLRTTSVPRLADPGGDLSDTTLRDIAWRAFLALVGILLTPFAIRALFYYGIAPAVERGRPIQLAVPSGLDGAPSSTEQSRPTISVTLAKEEELLVRQGFLQSSPATSDMRTQWLLSWRNVFTSLASGMVFLTRARGTSASFGISTGDDPFAELARIVMPEGSALVMQPRALAAIVQPQGKAMPIRSRWRLFSLHAWLTFQLRYLVFYGPGSLIVKGGRGVRVEQAASGRRFGQDQLVGFSAHTAYTVTRNETFLPYFFGREPLFRDRVADLGAGAQPGILVIEEAPMAGRRKGVRGGLEGAFDAVLKAFGI